MQATQSLLSSTAQEAICNYRDPHPKARSTCSQSAYRNPKIILVGLRNQSLSLEACISHSANYLRSAPQGSQRGKSICSQGNSVFLPRHSPSLSRSSSRSIEYPSSLFAKNADAEDARCRTYPKRFFRTKFLGQS